jgi:hypothetical protein
VTNLFPSRVSVISSPKSGSESPKRGWRRTVGRRVRLDGVVGTRFALGAGGRTQKPGYPVAVLLTLVFVLTLSACAGSTNRDSLANDPCRLLTDTQVSKITGGLTKKPLVTSTGLGCSYAAAGSGRVSLLVDVQEKTTDADWNEEQKAAQRDGATVQPLLVKGAQGFSYSAQGGSVQSAAVRKGPKEAEVLLTGTGSSPENARQALTAVWSALTES